jgi:hypothetical protein
VTRSLPQQSNKTTKLLKISPTTASFGQFSENTIVRIVSKHCVSQGQRITGWRPSQAGKCAKMQIAPTKQNVAASRRRARRTHRFPSALSANKNSPASCLLFVVAANCAGVARPHSPFINSTPLSLTAARSQLTSYNRTSIHNNCEEDATWQWVFLCVLQLPHSGGAARSRERQLTLLRVWEDARCTRTDTHLPRVHTSFAFAVIVYGLATRVNGSFI